MDQPVIYRTSVRTQGCYNRPSLQDQLQHVNWETMFRLQSCAEQFQYLEDTLNNLINLNLPYIIVKRCTSDRPWITEGVVASWAVGL